MADINQTNWTEADASNVVAPPDGWPAGMNPSQVEPTARAMMGAVKRWYDRQNPTVTSTGTANAHVVTYTVAPTALVAGDTFSFKVGASLTNTGAATLNVGVGGALAINAFGSALRGGELAAGQYVSVAYTGTLFALLGNSLTYLDARAFGLLPHGQDSTAAAQAALNCAYNNGIPEVRFPVSFDFTQLATFPNITIRGGGASNLWHRTAAGPGLYTTDTPSNLGHPLTAVYGVKIVDVAIDGASLAGCNITLISAINWRMDNCILTNAGRGSQFVGTTSGTNNATLTITGSPRGTPTVGDMVFGQGLERGATFSGSISGTVLTAGAPTAGTIKVGQYVVGGDNVNGVPADDSQIVSLGSGTGGAGTYNLSRSSTVATAALQTQAYPVLQGSSGSWTLSVGSFSAVTSAQMFSVSTWTFNDGTATRTLPSANWMLLGTPAAGGVFDGHASRVTCSGTYTSNPANNCSVDAGIGLALMASRSDGAQKPNGNLFESLYPYCCICGILIDTGSDNIFIFSDHEFDAIGIALGFNWQGANRNQFYTPYLEGVSAAKPTVVGILCDWEASGNKFVGAGSLVSVTTPILGNVWNTWSPYDDAHYHDGAVKHLLAQLPSAAPVSRKARSFNVYGKSDDDVEIASVAYGAGNVPYIAGASARNTMGSPAGTGSGDVVGSHTGYGWTSGSPGGWSGLAASVDVVAAEDFSPTSNAGELSLKTTPVGSTSPVERWRVGKTGGLYVTGGTDGGISTINLKPVTAPASPASGWTLYVDSGDSNKLKAKASTGTVVSLGTP